MLDKLQIYFSLVAALVSAIAGIYQGLSPIDMVVRLILVIIVFYVIGLYVRYYLRKNVFIETKAPPEAEDNADTGQEGQKDTTE